MRRMLAPRVGRAHMAPTLRSRRPSNQPPPAGRRADHPFADGPRATRTGRAMYIGRLAGSFVVAALVSSAAFAQTPPPAAVATPPAADPTPKPVTLTAGMDVASAYMFRGIFQEDSGFIGQPWIDAALTVYSGKGALSAITLNGGNWDSSHSGPTGTWYESDYYVQGT